jgi:hypothetical protein
MGKAPMANSDEQLLSILAALEKCRAGLVAGNNRDTAQLVSLAILDIRMRLNGIGDTDLKALCDEILPDDEPARRSPELKASIAQRRGPLLRLVK